MTNRRSFIASILAAATPPGFVRAGVLMPVAPLIVGPEPIWIGVDIARGTGDEAVLIDLETLARSRFSDWAAHRNASILEQYLTGNYTTSFR